MRELFAYHSTKTVKGSYCTCFKLEGESEKLILCQPYSQGPVKLAGTLQHLVVLALELLGSYMYGTYCGTSK